jgi:putative FmdB family regulatory protein
MPIYEYWCSHCRKKVTQYVRGFSEVPKAVCATCGGENLRRIFSSFAIHKTDMGVYDDILSDDKLVRGMMSDDPRALAEWSRRMEGSSGDSSPEYEEMLQRLDKGERVESIVDDMKQRQSGFADEEPSSDMLD